MMKADHFIHHKSLPARSFRRAMIAAFVSILIMMVTWPWLVLETSQKKSVQKLLRWDNMLSVTDPAHTLKEADIIYYLSAKHLKIIDEDSTEILLSRPHIRAVRDNGSWFDVIAKSGLYNQKTRVLQMIANVHITDIKGSDLHTDTAVVRIGERLAEGYSSISGRMGARIMVDAAEGFALDSSSNEYQFRGATEMVIKSKDS